MLCFLNQDCTRTVPGLYQDCTRTDGRCQDWWAMRQTGSANGSLWASASQEWVSSFHLLLIRGVPGLFLSLYSASSKLVRPKWRCSMGHVQGVNRYPKDTRFERASLKNAFFTCQETIRTSLNQRGANGFLTFGLGWYVVVHVAIGVCVGAYTGNRNVT